MSFLYFLSDIFYVVISRLYRKKVVEMNIRNSFPKLSEKELIQIKNRFYNLFKDPQKTAIEPFNRIGEDTYSSIFIIPNNAQQ